jgi:hypothetical protein
LFACQLINVANWVIFHEDVKKSVREIGMTKINL